MEKKRLFRVRLVVILVLLSFYLVQNSYGMVGGGSYTYHKQPKYFKVGVPNNLEFGFAGLSGTYGEYKVTCYYRMSGEGTFKTISMVKVGTRNKDSEKVKVLYSCSLPVFTTEQKDQFGSVEYYFDYYYKEWWEKKHDISDYGSSWELNYKVQEAKKKGENVIVVYGRAHKFSTRDNGLIDIEGRPIPFRVSLQ